MEAGELAPDLGPGRARTRAPARPWSPPARRWSPSTSSSTPRTPRSPARSPSELREAGGGLPGVRALGLPREGERAQVSINVHDADAVPLAQVVDGGDAAGGRARRPRRSRPSWSASRPRRRWRATRTTRRSATSTPTEHVIERVLGMPCRLSRIGRFRPMAQTKKKRRRKHRGTQGGRVDTRPKGRPRNRAEAQAARPVARQVRGERREARHRRPAAARHPPTWGSAIRKGGSSPAALLRAARAAPSSEPVGASAALAGFMLLFYVPMGYLHRPLLLQPPAAQGSSRSGRASQQRQAAPSRRLP